MEPNRQAAAFSYDPQAQETTLAIVPEKKETQTIITIPNSDDIGEQVPDIVKKANALEIVTEEQYAIACAFGISTKGLIDEVKSTFKESKALADKTHASICAAEKKHLDPLNNALIIAKDKCRVYINEKNRLKAMADLKARQEKEAEAERLRKQDLARKEEDRINQAAELEALGFKDEAQAVIEAPIAASSIVAQVSYSAPAVQKIKGASSRIKYTFEITDPMLIDRQYLLVDESKIRKMVNALGPEFKCAGVKVFEDTQINFSAKK